MRMDAGAHHVRRHPRRVPVPKEMTRVPVSSPILRALGVRFVEVRSDGTLRAVFRPRPKPKAPSPLSYLKVSK